MQAEYIGIDIGGTGLKAGCIIGDQINNQLSLPVLAHGTQEEVIDQVCDVISNILTPNCLGIGIGVPGLVNPNSGIVYDVMNIPAWKKLDLKSSIEKEFNLPVAVENDANCFALGAFTQRKQPELNSMLGVTIGTGLGTGIILNGQLISGRNGGAGEFGLIPYLTHDIEYYASGRFFENKFGINGLDMFQQATQGIEKALAAYHELGVHFGNALKTMLYSLDINYFILGGSVSKAWQYFEAATRNQLSSFVYQQAIENLVIEVAENQDAGILGAAMLINQKNQHDV